jgi:hypothetical protein
MDFAFSLDHPDRHSAFINRHAQIGELEEYSPYTPATRGKMYGVIAFLPNFGASGIVLILEGLTMVGTEATINLAIDDKRLLPLLNSIRKKMDLCRTLRCCSRAIPWEMAPGLPALWQFICAINFEAAQE